jgi:hypothetical protein
LSIESFERRCPDPVSLTDIDDWRYYAPEMMQDGAFDESADVYTFAIIAAEILVRYFNMVFAVAG